MDEGHHLRTVPPMGAPATRIRSTRPVHTATVGMEIDGRRVVVVQVSNRTLTAHRIVMGDTLEESLTLAASGIPAGTRVCVSLTSETPRTSTLTAPRAPQSHDELRGLLGSTTGDAAGGTDVAHAAVFGEPVHVGQSHQGLVCSWPGGVVGAVRRALGAHEGAVDILPAPFTAGAVGDLVLALRDTGAELTYSQDARATRSAALSAGGLLEVEALLGSGDQVGASRVADAITRGGVVDPLAGSALDGWLRDVLGEVVTQIAAWQGQGLDVPRRIHVHGHAATAVSLPYLLADFDLAREILDPGVSAGLRSVPSKERADLIGAYAAATTNTSALGPVATLDDPAGAHDRAVLAARGRVRARRRLTLAVAATLAVTAGGPLAVVEAHHAWTGAQLSTTQSAVAAHLAVPAAPGQSPGTQSPAHQLVALTEAASHLPSPVDVTALGRITGTSSQGVAVVSADESTTAGGVQVDVKGTAASPAALAGLVDQWAAAGLRANAVTEWPSEGVWAFTAQVHP